MSAGGFTSFNFPSPVRGGVEIQAESIRRVVTPDYFGALDVQIAAGRPLTAEDTIGSPTAVVVNRSFVRKFLDDIPVATAVGLSLGQVAVRGTKYAGGATIVGVANDLRQDAVDAPDQPEMFVAFDQLSEPSLGASSIVVIRTADDPTAYLEALRSAVREGLPPAFANVEACGRLDFDEPDGSRYIDEDYNRVWADEALFGTRDSIELRRG